MKHTVKILVLFLLSLLACQNTNEKTNSFSKTKSIETAESRIKTIDSLVKQKKIELEKSKIEKTDFTTKKKQTETVESKITILKNTEYNNLIEKKYGFKSWNPKTQDLNLVQEILDKAYIRNLEKYYRQYIPYINEKGEKFIEINAFCEKLEYSHNRKKRITEFSKRDWENEYVEVDDGGNCYWQIIINVDKKEIKDFFVNGEG
ncbi:hypothetical protein [Flammeovirga agarivorans]|uniref:Lipoprotein n=1 Tax=Flammeovirga agarivorans TaxID=2726742 RepID=A0A7X8XZG8_9BACT|nr:hypothetical protein [Flammeovirga agarivorans]NLR95043.1 hypothetical protein [Flammeovirga agarivorans]